MARPKHSMAPSDSPCQTLRNPPRNQAAARFGLSTRARSSNAMPPLRIDERYERALIPRHRQRDHRAQRHPSEMPAA